MMFFAYIGLALLMALGALYFLWQGHEQRLQEQMASRLVGAGLQALEFPAKDRMTLMLERAGIFLAPVHQRLVAWVLLMLVLLCGLQFGWIVMLILLAVIVGFAYTALNVLFSRRQALIITQMPRLLDQVVRLLRTGKTLGDAFTIATRDAEEPLRTVMARLQRNMSLGMTQTEAFDDLAETYALKELQVLALGVQVNARFGGSLVELLSNIITLIQQREQMSRQLRAMTGETRTSALVLSALPLFVGGFMTFSNPDYLMTLVEDPTGKWVLMGAAVMQIAGMLVIWRMLKSV